MAEHTGPTRKYKFSGHQTFVFRHGWLEKGVRAVGDCPEAFSKEDALVHLGVGKNMVESIKHWCLVTQLLEEHEGKAGQGFRISTIGRKLLLSWDPFLEDDASLWLIHWLLVTNLRIGTTWQLMFGEFFRPDFTKRELVECIASFVAKQSLRVQQTSILRDVDCFIRTYVSTVGAGKKALVTEDSFDCPLQALNLIQPCPDGELYRFAIGPKPSLPPAIVAFALNEFFDRNRGDRNTLSIQECLYGPNSPGQVFKLDENTLVEYLEDIQDATRRGILLDETAGLKQVYRRRPIDAFLLLDHYYGTEAKK